MSRGPRVPALGDRDPGRPGIWVEQIPAALSQGEWVGVRLALGAGASPSFATPASPSLSFAI